MGYAVIRTGGKQYRVMEGGSLRVEKLEGNVGEEVELGDVLMVVRDGAQPVLDAKDLGGLKVKARIVRHGRGKKILNYRFFRRKGFHHMQGHRQDFTEIKISALP